MKNNELLWIGGITALLFFMGKKTTATPAPTPSPLPVPSPTHLSDEETLIQAWIERIKATPEWMAEIIRKAPDYGNTIEQQLRYDAIWVIKQGWQL